MAIFLENLAADLRMTSGGKASFYLFLKNFAFDPGLRLLFFYRLSALCYARPGLRVLGLFFWQIGILLSACHISPKAVIRGGICFPHPTGIVIGDLVEIDEGCVIYQNVTLGRISRNRDGYPKLERDVILYAGATVVGSLTIGERAIVGAHAFISKSIEPKSRIGANEAWQ